MISDFNDITHIFKEINQHLTNQVNLYVIGGAVLLYHGLKPATKDIDVIISNTDAYDAFLQALTDLHFTRKTPTKQYKKMDASAIVEKEEARFDIFLRQVCKKITLTETMKNRGSLIVTTEHLKVFLCGLEDIFIFKSITERSGDLEDCIALAKRGVQWDTILHEIQSQIQHSGEDVWITWVGERMDILKDRGINIPIMDEIDTLRHAFFKKIENKYARKNRS